MGFITRSSQLYSFNKNNLEFLRRTLVPNETLAIVLLDLIKRNHFFARGTACPDDLRWAKSLFFVAKSFLQTAQMVWPTFSSSTSLSSFLLRRFLDFDFFDETRSSTAGGAGVGFVGVGAGTDLAAESE